MARRVVLALAVVQCAGCSAADDPVEKHRAAGGDVIACAIGAGSTIEEACPVERLEEEGARILVVRHPDGGFRRFRVLEDGHGLAVADGADDARIALDGETIEVSVGLDRYRFPVTLSSDAADE